MKIRPKPSAWLQSEKAGFVWLALLPCLMLFFLLIAPYLPDERPHAIRKELERQGYDIENITFTYMKDGDGYKQWIYESSEPIVYHGKIVSQWSLSNWRFSSFIVRYNVAPYPPPKRVPVTISFTAEEYEELSRYAHGQSVEEYVRSAVKDSIAQKAAESS